MVSGAYRYMRNPMYTVASLMAGQGLLIGYLPLRIYALAFGGVTYLFVLVYEEPTLGGTYGAQYEAYAAEVRRWLPRLTPWRTRAPSRPTARI